MARLECHVEGGAWFGGMLENWLRICVAYDNLGRGAVLLHSAGIVRENRAAVLFGHSGAGKSTCSALAKSEGCSVISDDINLIRPGESTWQVVPLPFSGTFNEHSDIERPVVLDGLFHLNQAGRNGREDCSAARAVSLLAASSPFVNSDPWMAEALMENLSRLVSMVPVRKLFFQRDPSFIEWVFGAAS